MPKTTTRREALRAGALGGAGLAAWSLASNRLVERALAASARTCGRLQDIQHIVILIQENRSFDHYFGSLRGVAGFADPQVLKLGDGSGLSVLAQPGYPGGYLPGLDGRGHLYPFHLDTTTSQGECTNDITHSWSQQHQAWNGGAMDGFVKVHLASEGPQNGPLTMGYYTRQDLPFYYGLADAFTICDHYHCSVIGPTDPNRLYTMSATLDPDGHNGGPLTGTLTSNRIQNYGKYTWKTMPEVLQEAGVSWRVYAAPENDGPISDDVLPYFAAYTQDAQLAANAFGHLFPGDFQADCAAGTLPQVSWVVAPVLESEHPPLPVTWGEVAASQVLQALLSNQAVWESSALIVTYDENGGFFDHVPPPTAPPGTPGEYLTAPGSADPHKPIGLGFRVPALVVSPFARGGFVASETFDHTSTLKLLAARFAAEGVHVPNISAWRDATVGDMTSAFNFAKVDASVPAGISSPTTQPSLADQRVIGGDCMTSAPASEYSETGPGVQYYPATVNTAPPAQEPGAGRAPSGPVRCTAS